MIGGVLLSYLAFEDSDASASSTTVYLTVISIVLLIFSP